MTQWIPTPEKDRLGVGQLAPTLYLLSYLFSFLTLMPCIIFFISAFWINYFFANSVDITKYMVCLATSVFRFQGFADLIVFHLHFSDLQCAARWSILPQTGSW